VVLTNQANAPALSHLTTEHLATKPIKQQQINQIGTITESIEAVKMSKAAGWGVMASHRCDGEGR
jgi:enolase